MSSPATPICPIDGEPIRTIVAGSALDSRSDQVVRAARDLARRTGATLIVVHAAPIPLLVPGTLLDDTELLSRMRGELEVDLRRQAQRLELDSLDPAPVLRVEDGLPDLLLGRIAAESSADLVVVGATTAGGRLGKLLGSTAERLLRWGETPVLIVREELPLPPRRVLAPVDLSRLSRDAFRRGLRILAQLAAPGEISVETLLVVPPPDASVLPETVQRAESELGDFLASTPAPGLSLRPRILTGEARQQILRETEDEEWDLVMLGTRGTSGIRRTLGSVTADVSREAPCSVLVVPPRAAVGDAIAEAVEEQAHPLQGRR